MKGHEMKKRKGKKARPPIHISGYFTAKLLNHMEVLVLL